jgi:hypothetical protein
MLRTPTLVVLLAALGGCGSPPLKVAQEAGCDSLNPRHCLLPYPSSRYLTSDLASATGLRVTYPAEVLPPNAAGVRPSPTLFVADGFSPGTGILTSFVRKVSVERSAAATQHTIGRSLEADSPTVLFDVTSGQRLAHWVETDSLDPTVLWLHPAQLLQEDHTVAVAIRQLVDEGGEALPVDAAFAALRDGQPTDAPDLETRRPDFEVLFEALERAGVGRRGLQAGWQFHIASGAWLRSELIALRDDMLARMGPQGLGCTVSSVEDGYGAGTAVVSYRRVRGTYRVPSYMTSPTPPARLYRVEGRPAFKELVDVPFTAIVPTSVKSGGRPTRTIVYGHGLMAEGERTISSVEFRKSLDGLASVAVATDWAGMSVSDLGAVAGALGNVNQFLNVTDRLHQGILNTLALGRAFKGSCAQMPEFEGLIDPRLLSFAGGSQGGILGATLLALATDFDRGVLMVNAAAFTYLMPRSIDFSPFLPQFEAAYPNPLERALVLTMLQGPWDHTDPAGWLPHLTRGLPSLTPKRLLSVTVKNDAQVPNLGSDFAMRSAGLGLMAGSARDPWGFSPAGADPQSAYLVVDMGDRPVPETNVAPTQNDKGHSRVIGAASVLRTIDDFLRPDGKIVGHCSGVCDPD